MFDLTKPLFLKTVLPLEDIEALTAFHQSMIEEIERLREENAGLRSILARIEANKNAEETRRRAVEKKADELRIELGKARGALMHPCECNQYHPIELCPRTKALCSIEESGLLK